MIVASMGLMLSMLPGLGGLPGVPAPAPRGPDTSCVVMDLPTEDRLSPLDSLSFSVAGHTVKICYGRPSARGRTMIGGRDVPYGKLWRTGANEPTMIHTMTSLNVAGIEIGWGSYSLYTVPGEDEWVVIVNRSITQWGHIAQYNYKVKAQEVGKAKLPREQLDQHVETMTFRVEPADGDAVTLVLEWERTRVRIPITPAGS
jgi:hypothetical protein